MQIESDRWNMSSPLLNHLPEKLNVLFETEEEDLDTLFENTALPTVAQDFDLDFLQLRLPSEIGLDVYSLEQTEAPQETKGARKGALDKSKSSLEVSKVSLVKMYRSNCTLRLRQICDGKQF